MSANMKMSIDCEIIYNLNQNKILKYNIVMVKLEDYTSTELKKMISSFNKIVKFAGYSKLKKAELINMIRTHPKIKVEEGANAVKLSIKTDEDFEKQKKVKKEKVKKEVKKEVEKLDDVKVVVKKEEEPEKKKEEIKQLDIQKNIFDFEEENKSWKQFLKDFKQGKTKFGGKIKLEDYEKNKIKLKKLLEKTDILGRKLVNQDIRNESDFYKGLVKTFISERNKITRLYNKAKTRFNNLSYLLDYGGVETEKKKEEKKKEEPKNEQELYREQKKELDEKTLNMILKEDKDILLKPSEVDDPKQSKKIKKLYKKVFETYKKSYGDLLDKYDFSKSNYRKDASNNFNLFIRRARQQPKKEEKKKEPEKKPEKDKLLSRLVMNARSHAKNGISVEGLKEFFNNVQEYKKTNPPKLQSQLAGVLYNFLNKNVQMGKKKLPNNMNNVLKELGYKEIKK